MNLLKLASLALIFSAPIFAAETTIETTIETTTETTTETLPTDEKARCQLAATEIIELLKQSRTGDIKRQQLIASLLERLQTNEDPCAVYTDAFNATFSSE